MTRKEFIKSIIGLIICGIIIVWGMTIDAEAAIPKTREGYYAETFMVSKVKGNKLYLTTQSGNTFVIREHTDDDYERGDIISAVMDSRGTKTVYDDRVITWKYSGWTNKPNKWVKR